MYDPTIGRWISQDPLGIQIPGPDGETLESETNLEETGRYTWESMEKTPVDYTPKYYHPSRGWVSIDGSDGMGESNLYRYVHNAPTDATDPSGLDVRLETTAAAGGFHQRVSVDVWDGEGKKVGFFAISFAFNDKAPLGLLDLLVPAGLGSSASGPGFGSGCASGTVISRRARLSGPGIVSQDKDKAVRVVDTIKTTPDQDRIIKKFMEGLIDTEGPYNACLNSCRDFSQALFAAIRAVIEKMNKP